MKIFDLDPDYRPEAWGRHFDDLRRRKTVALETRHRTKDRRDFPVDVVESLLRMNAELSKASRLKDEFLASLSHELRTPLNGVLALSESLLEDVYGPVNPDQAAALKDIEQSSRHLLALLNDILDLSKIEAGQRCLAAGAAEYVTKPVSPGKLREMIARLLGYRPGH